MRFGHGRKTKNDENCISATAETEEMPHNGFPTPWKWKKRLKTGFPTPWKWKKCLKTGFPTPWKQKDRCLGRIRFIVIFVI